jgi:peptidoglycan/xylan/chitin deacetylase (PgdA/CDA1 family)
VWVTPENAAEVATSFDRIDEINEAAPPHTAYIPVLLYHHITDSPGRLNVPPGLFEEHMGALSGAGYSAVSLADIYNYVFRGTGLPERPVLITFDGGYMSIYSEAFPILQRYGFSAAVFVAGSLFGKDANETGGPAVPHFGTDEALEMIRSGLITIQSHSFDMHWAPQNGPTQRQGVLRMDGESEQDYIDAFRGDFAEMSDLLAGSIGTGVYAFSYPHGLIDLHSSILLRELNAAITFTSQPGMNTLIRGLPQSLYELGRFEAGAGKTGDDILNMIK